MVAVIQQSILKVNDKLNSYLDNTRISSYLNLLEQKIHVERSIIVFGMLGILASYLVIGWGNDFVCNFIGILYPIYASLSAIQSPKTHEDRQLLIYWIVYSSLSCIEYLGYELCHALVFYWLVKCIFLIWLMKSGSRKISDSIRITVAVANHAQDEVDILSTDAYEAENVRQFWYKEKMSREDAINVLKTKPPGTFLIRQSQAFPGSYDLVVKVKTLPPGIQPKPETNPNAQLVRHYLIERTSNEHVHLKGYLNEPNFVNLSALVYQHSLNPLALPIKLVLPVVDLCNGNDSMVDQEEHNRTRKTTIKDLLERGAACNVVYLNNVDVKSLSGQKAINEALRSTFENAHNLQPTIVHFKVTTTGITLIDTKKKLFTRRDFPKEYVTYCSVDNETDRSWTHQFLGLEMLPEAQCFGFVFKKINEDNESTKAENECHIFAEIDQEQPSAAIVNFVSKVMIGSVPD